MVKVLILSLCMSFLGVQYSIAQGLADPCLGDLKEYCAHVEQGGGRIMNCLLDNKDNLTSGCRVRVLRIKEILSDLKKSCNNDILKLCDNQEPGEGRLIRCLRDNADKLTSACKVEIEKAKHARRSINDTI